MAAELQQSLGSTLQSSSVVLGGLDETERSVSAACLIAEAKGAAFPRVELAKEEWVGRAYFLAATLRAA